MRLKAPSPRVAFARSINHGVDGRHSRDIKGYARQLSSRHVGSWEYHSFNGCFRKVLFLMSNMRFLLLSCCIEPVLIYTILGKLIADNLSPFTFIMSFGHCPLSLSVSVTVYFHHRPISLSVSVTVHFHYQFRSLFTFIMSFTDNLLSIWVSVTIHFHYLFQLPFNFIIWNEDAMKVHGDWGWHLVSSCEPSP